jgi:protease-4
MSWTERWQRAWRPVGNALGLTWQRLVCALANGRRRLRRGRWADYAVILMDHAVTERAPDVPWWYAYIPGLKLPLSLEYIHNALRRIAQDPDIKGVVFLLKGPSLSLAQAQSMARLLDRFRTWDAAQRAPGAPAKQIVVHLEEIGAAAYVMACAADQITVPPLTSWDVLGLRVAPTYLKDTLAKAGLAFDVVKIAPWKTAADTLARSDMSAAEREQVNWLLDSLSEDIVAAIAQGRGLAEDHVRALIDRAPLTADDALAAGLVDAIAYEDELPDRLGEAGQPARLKAYAQVRGLLLRRPQLRTPRRIGVLSLQGSIIVGNSRSLPIPIPLLGGRFIGSSTVEQQVRAARQDDRLAAIVVHVDSGGGSALASDLIWRELHLLNQEKPVIVYMGDVAASGGYYIAAPGRKIVAQSATITGSIGVVAAKGVTQDLRAKAGAHREVVRRGANAGLFSDDQHWSDDQRHKVEENIVHIYGRFKQVVAEGRGMALDGLDAVANGRVWTGRQALAHGLVDALGDFQAALAEACRAAGLPDDGSVRTRVVSTPPARLMAEPVQPGQAARTAVRVLFGAPARPGEDWGAVLQSAAALMQGDWPRLLGRERFWLIDPDLPRFE